MVKTSLFTIDHFTLQKEINHFLLFLSLQDSIFILLNSNLDIEWFRFVYNIQFYHILPILDFLLPDSKRTGGTYLL